MRARTNSYDSSEAAAISGLPRMTVDYLARMEVVIPSVEAKPGRGRPRLYSFGDLVALRAVKALLNAKVEVANVKSCIATLQRKYGKTLTNCPADYLFTDGRSVYLRDGKDSFADVTKGGQLVFLFMCDLKQMHVQTERAAAKKRVVGE